MAAELPEMITIGKGVTVTFLKDNKYETRISASGVPGDEELSLPLHWHEKHDEYVLVVEGKLQMTRGTEIRVYGPEDGEQMFERGIPHSLKSVGNCVILDRTVPDDSIKQLFIRNMMAGGSMSTDFFDIMHNCYYGDVIPSLPGGIHWLEKAFLTLFGYYIAPLLGYQRKIKTL
ncbi:uncharacterized protein BT62DRAFT_927409 [Guyanagaster necrorhizus]|uniref:Uncharacterized protein n=1 Tax=Guyanagaster necrorhizus TaxID=856835 RepID=A0A9P7W3T7_9AGAR|nr:uncharacterized protein BT62DRAFT_927409 [Guyanagaster necrorhizus MCA 3950]KAG7451673.1 hypothetical protein BT62DRAFT_927409 [Guyanagaster necrorhizus MCA 3950]